MAHRPEHLAKRADTVRSHRLPMSNWKPSELPGWLTRDVYVNQIQPALARISKSSIRTALGISEPETLNEILSYDANRLLGIAFFWFLIGRSIDRRRHKQEALDLRHPIPAGVLFTFLALVCGLLGFGGVAEFRHRLVWRVITAYPLRTWDTMNLGFEVWALVFFVYFARRAFIAARRSLTKTA